MHPLTLLLHLGQAVLCASLVCLGGAVILSLRALHMLDGR